MRSTLVVIVLLVVMWPVRSLADPACAFECANVCPGQGCDTFCQIYDEMLMACLNFNCGLAEMGYGIENSCNALGIQIVPIGAPVDCCVGNERYANCQNYESHEYSCNVMTEACEFEVISAWTEPGPLIETCTTSGPCYDAECTPGSCNEVPNTYSEPCFPDEIICWGDNSFGQLNRPAGSFRQIAVGPFHNCAIRTDDDTVSCWGLADQGATTPVAGAFASLAAGNRFTCGIERDTAAIACWGRDNEGQVSNAPAGTFQQVTALGNSACALSLANEITCWGVDGGIISEAPPGQFLQVTTGCALRSADQRIVCWGPVAAGMPTIATPSVDQYLNISRGSGYVCGIRADTQGIDCFGDGAIAQWSAPEYFEAPGEGLFRVLGPANANICALYAFDYLTCWGIDDYGESSLAPRGIPFIEVGTGSDHGCGIQLADPNLLGIGICESGTRECSGGTMGLCMGAVLPEPEVCDSLDRNCDGILDNPPEGGCECGPLGSTLPCFSAPFYLAGTGLCASGIQTCVDNVPCAGDFCWGECIGEVLPTTEVCDGDDNDCDGEVDNVAPMPCYTGPAGTEDVGICLGGFATCDDCIGEVTPEPAEICGNDLDDDCNGLIDDGCPGCLGPEVCDGLDTDCDGIVDNNEADDDCPGVEFCHLGACVSPCIAGADCAPLPCYLPAGYCEVNACAGVICHGAEVCVSGGCMRPCAAHVDCPGGSLCTNGYCAVGGDPCNHIQCPNTTDDERVCHIGHCYPSCDTNDDCDGGDICFDGRCAQGPCSDVTCPIGFECINGACAAPCDSDAVCDPGQSCYDHSILTCTGASLNPVPAGRFSEVTIGTGPPTWACALRKENQGLVCWANLMPPAGVTDAPTGTAFQTIDASFGTGCGILLDGQIQCWGDNGFNLVDNAPAGTFKKVSVGQTFACAIGTDDLLTCWGVDFVGALSDAPTEVVRDIAVASFAACAIMDDFSVYCWGQDQDGNTIAPPDLHVSIDAGLAVTCALRDNFRANCWGTDAQGVVTGAPADEFRSIAVSNNHACGLRLDGTLSCWGSPMSPEIFTFSYSEIAAGGSAQCGITRYGLCQAGPCEGVGCPPGETCMGGACFPSCENNDDCTPPEYCWPDGGCAINGCAGTTCTVGEVCHMGGCYESCNGDVDCSNPAHICYQNRCVDQIDFKCDGIVCPVGDVCVAGACIEACLDDIDCSNPDSFCYQSQFCAHPDNCAFYDCDAADEVCTDDGLCFQTCSTDTDCTQNPAHTCQTLDEPNVCATDACAAMQEHLNPVSVAYRTNHPFVQHRFQLAADQRVTPRHWPRPLVITESVDDFLFQELMNPASPLLANRAARLGYILDDNDNLFLWLAHGTTDAGQGPAQSVYSIRIEDLPGVDVVAAWPSTHHTHRATDGDWTHIQAMLTTTAGQAAGMVIGPLPLDEEFHIRLHAALHEDLERWEIHNPDDNLPVGLDHRYPVTLRSFVYEASDPFFARLSSALIPGSGLPCPYSSPSLAGMCLEGTLSFCINGLRRCEATLSPGNHQSCGRNTSCQQIDVGGTFVELTDGDAPDLRIPMVYYRPAGNLGWIRLPSYDTPGEFTTLSSFVASGSDGAGSLLIDREEGGSLQTDPHQAWLFVHRSRSNGILSIPLIFGRRGSAMGVSNFDIGVEITSNDDPFPGFISYYSDADGSDVVVESFTPGSLRARFSVQEVGGFFQSDAAIFQIAPRHHGPPGEIEQTFTISLTPDNPSVDTFMYIPRSNDISLSGGPLQFKVVWEEAQESRCMTNPVDGCAVGMYICADYGANAHLTCSIANPLFCQCEDLDGDGFYGRTPSCPTGLDCDDGDPNVYPGAPERCDGRDSNCNEVPGVQSIQTAVRQTDGMTINNACPGGASTCGPAECNYQFSCIQNPDSGIYYCAEGLSQ